MNNKQKILLFTSIVLFNITNYTYANPATTTNNSIGEIHIDDSSYKDDNIKKSNPNDTTYQDVKSVGVLKINEDINKINPNEKHISNEIYQKIISELESISTAQNKKDYKTALQKVVNLKNHFPEIFYFQKWEAIYQNKLKEYNTSEEVFNNLLLNYPFEQDKINNDLIIKYYRIDNHIQLGEYDLAEKELKTYTSLINSIDDNDTSMVYDIKVKDLYTILVKYQNFILNNYSHKEEDINQDELDDIWNTIPVKYQKYLDNFYGYDLSELEYLYGKHYNRKDILKAYVQQEETNAIDSSDIKKIKDAKSILFREY